MMSDKFKNMKRLDDRNSNTLELEELGEFPRPGVAKLHCAGHYFIGVPLVGNRACHFISHPGWQKI